MLKALVTKGLPIILAEVRGHAPDTIEYSDKKTGQKVTSPLHRFAVETGDMAHTLQLKIMVWRPKTDFATIKRGDFLLIGVSVSDIRKGECTCEEDNIVIPTAADLAYLMDNQPTKK